MITKNEQRESVDKNLIYSRPMDELQPTGIRPNRDPGGVCVVVLRALLITYIPSAVVSVHKKTR